MVRVDSTGNHNRFLLAGHGRLENGDLDDINQALDAAPRGHLVVLALHHHLLPMPLDTAAEMVPTLFGRGIWTAEIDAGYDLVRSIIGRCDLILHGHRHGEREFVLEADGPRPLRICNAGSSTEIGRMRIFTFRGARMQVPYWQTVSASAVVPPGLDHWAAAGRGMP